MVPGPIRYVLWAQALARLWVLVQIKLRTSARPTFRERYKNYILSALRSVCYLSSASRDLRVAIPQNVYSSVRLDGWRSPRRYDRESTLSALDSQRLDVTRRQRSRQRHQLLIARHPPAKVCRESFRRQHSQVPRKPRLRVARGCWVFVAENRGRDWPELDISAYNQLELEIPYTDGKKYTFNLKDTIPPAGTNDRASVSWGYDFQLLVTTQTEDGSVSADLQRVAVPIKDLVPTFNGRLVNKSAPLNVTGIKRISIMMLT